MDKLNKSENNNGKHCNYCKKSGLYAHECLTRLRVERAPKGDKGNRKNTRETRECYHRGKTGHLMAHCRKRKSDDQGTNNKGKYTRYVDDNFEGE